MFGDAKLRKRVSELEESLRRIELAFEKLEHAYGKIEVEWTETYDKFRQLHWRVAKRAKQLEENSAESVELQQSPPGDQELDSSVGGLTPQQIEANRKILARRMRGRILPQ